jgi:hypothetical protein
MLNAPPAQGGVFHSKVRQDNTAGNIAQVAGVMKTRRLPHPSLHYPLLQANQRFVAMPGRTEAGNWLEG